MNARSTFACCAALLGLFGAVSYGSVLTKSATFDEPVAVVAGWVRLHYGDFRVDFEDPPLWEEWAALPNGPQALKPDFTSADWTDMPRTPYLQWRFSTEALWATPGVKGVDFVNHSRAMMLVFGLGLGALIAWWAWHLAGWFAALVAVTLFSLDPNFLAHSSLVKNDVCIALVMLGTAFLMWRIGQKPTSGRIALLVLVCGVAAGLKFSTTLLAPILALLLAVRSMGGPSWPLLYAKGESRSARLAASAVLLVVIGAGAVLVIWAAYRFRFSATPEGIPIDPAYIAKTLRQYQTGAAAGGMAKIRPEDLAAWRPDTMTNVLQYVLDLRLLPEAWIKGFLYMYASSQLRTSFLFGVVRETGWWYYFPVAMLLKTPIATLLLFFASVGVGIPLAFARRRPFEQWWTAACLTIPPAVYLGVSMLAHINIGIRHVLPVYGFVYVACGVVAAAALRRWGSRVRYAAAALGAALALETAAAAPNFLPFFNVAAGGPAGGIDLLGDSNLDWGQDLPLLAKWQHQNPEPRLYLSYFGMVDPDYYGIRYLPLPGNYQFGPAPDGEGLRLPAVLAISAYHLQGTAVGTDLGDVYANLRRRKPLAVLGGSIYLYAISEEADLE